MFSGGIERDQWYASRTVIERLFMIDLFNNNFSYTEVFVKERAASF